MIQIFPLKEKEEVKALFQEKGVEFEDGSCAVVAKEDFKQLGYCLFDLNGNEITIKALEPVDNPALADGILRSALHMALLREIHIARFSDGNLSGLLSSLGFIDDEKDRVLNLSGIFRGCCGSTV
ncbi:MAG TPA: hypothetical protein GXX17_05385 [Clostridiales bacterium]|nr:hypothetical protein [Clostridiales bacterium]